MPTNSYFLTVKMFMEGLKGALGTFPNFYTKHSLNQFKGFFCDVTGFCCFDTRGHIVRVNHSYCYFF